VPRRSQNSMPCSVPSGEDQNELERRRNLSVLCSERASGIASVPIRRMELAVRPDELQQAPLRALRDAVAQAGELLKMDCPTYRPITPVVRIETMEERLDTMLRAINIVQPALQNSMAHSLMSRKSASIGSRGCRDDSLSRGEASQSRRHLTLGSQRGTEVCTCTLSFTGERVRSSHSPRKIASA
jgi:hypothetical protein